MTLIYQSTLPSRTRGEAIKQEQHLEQSTRTSRHTSSTATQTDEKEKQEIAYHCSQNEMSRQPLLLVVLRTCHKLDTLLLPPTILHTLHALTSNTYLTSPLSISILSTALHDLKSQIPKLSREELLHRLEGLLPAVDKLEEVRTMLSQEIEKLERGGEQREWLEKMWEGVNDRCVALYEGCEELESAL